MATSIPTGGCGCSTNQILAAINENLVEIANNGGGGGAVNQLIAGDNITLDPANGMGVVTINATGGGAGEWGDIGGDIEDQTDLQAALAGKVDDETVANSEALALALGDSTGVGVFMRNTYPNLDGYNLSASPIFGYYTMPDNNVQVAEPVNIYNATADGQTLTYAFAGAVPAGLRTILKITASGANRTVTIPSTWSISRGGNITSVVIPEDLTVVIGLEYTGSRWEAYGDPVATVGAGSFVLSEGALSVASGKTLTAANSITLAGTDGTTMTLPPASASLGYMDVPQNSQSADYTTVMADRGKHILHPSSDANNRTFTIDSNANVAYPIGTAITFINQINTVTIAITSDTMTLYSGTGTGTTGSRTLASGGMATAIKVGTTSWVISGTGLT